MKHLFLTLLLATLCAASGYGQTIKALGYNTTNGVVIGPTNTLTFTNSITRQSQAEFGGNSGVLFFFDLDGAKDIFAFDNFEADAPRARTNLGLGATWLTNTNATNFRTAIGLGATNNVVFNQAQVTTELIITDGGLISFEDTGEIQFGNAAGPTRTNLGLPLPALTNTSNVTMMRALAGSTNTNHPYSGSISVVGTNNTNTLVFSNGILLEVQ